MLDNLTKQANELSYKLAEIALELAVHAGQGYEEALTLVLKAWENKAIPTEIEDRAGLVLSSCHNGLIAPEYAATTMWEMFATHRADDAAE
ncbi:hypothetical protein [Corynebacterium sp. HMSC28B08]|uniref:hypothetical protein n=1 Tax=Corynebacterium TaxID=1716 RepID=UPI0008A27640|nr:hypothetical protein [Corynebacterium sp. HMSC28B08]OFT91067.1 hypothetical protein HMPREF3098_01595 [Corynebacterium sp. HMSC28B08]